jgi:hypothetical protein
VQELKREGVEGHNDSVCDITDEGDGTRINGREAGELSGDEKAEKVLTISELKQVGNSRVLGRHTEERRGSRSGMGRRTRRR